MGKKFTDRYVKSLEPKGKRYDVREGEGFGVRVSPNGTKTFFLFWTRDGVKRRKSYGEYPLVSVAEAHSMHREDLRKLEKNIDPTEEARTWQQAPTIPKLIDLYLEEWAKPRKRSWKTDERILRKDVEPAWKYRKAPDISRRDVKELLGGIVARGAPAMANMTASVVRKMFAWAVEEELLEHSPAFGVRDPATRNAGTRVLSEREIKTLWRGLGTRTKTSDAAARALRLILATAQRPGEVLGMTWEEVTGEGARLWWTIPAERSKNGLPHRVPLSPLALEIMGSEGKGVVLPSPYPGREGKPMHADALNQAVRGALKALKVPKFTPHDLRRTAASHMTSMGISRLVVSKILNHAEPGVTAVYDRHSYDHEKRQGLEAWGRKLTAIAEGRKADNVVELATAR